MERNSLPRNYVHIEITESAVMENEAYEGYGKRIAHSGL